MRSDRSRSPRPGRERDPSAALHAEVQIDDMLESAMQSLRRARELLNHERDQLRQERSEFEEEKEAHSAKVDQLKKAGSKYAEALPSRVKLNVGGQVFETSKTTLLSEADTYFYALLHSGKFSPDSDGMYFIDRDPRSFRYILNYLRDGTLVDLDSLDLFDRQVLLKDIDYYQVNSFKYVVAHHVPGQAPFNDWFPSDSDEKTFAKMLAQGIFRVLEREKEKTGQTNLTLTAIPDKFQEMWGVLFPSSLDKLRASGLDLRSLLQLFPKKFRIIDNQTLVQLPTVAG